MPYISLSDFKARNSIVVATYDAQLTYLLEKFSLIIDKEVGGIFSLVAKTTADEMRYYGQPAGTNFIKIAVWQKANLVVKSGSFGSENLKTLVKNTDYYLKHKNDNQNEPVTGLKFPNKLLFAQEFVQIEGSYGYSDTIPSKLAMLIDDAVLVALGYRLRNQIQIKTKGYQLQSEKSGNLNVSLNSNPAMEKYGAALNSGNLMAVPDIFEMISNYKSLFTNNILFT